MEYDLLIKQGMIVDGSGNPWYRSDVGIKEGRIAHIGHITASSSEEILASGMFVTPGFVDMHTHSDLSLLVNPKAESYVRQGVTTEVIGNCGFSAAPLGGGQKEIHCFGPKPKVEVGWHSLGEYLDQLERARLSQNVVPLVGHGAIRLMVMGYDARPARYDEIQDMKSVLASAMKDGAFGLSSGLEYAPGISADTVELTELCKTVSEYRGVFVCHVRDRGEKLVESIQEIIEIGRKCSIPVHISHIWPKWPHADKGRAARELVDNARDCGLDVTFDAHIWEWACGVLRDLLPPWAFEGGVEATLSRLRDSETRERMGKKRKEPVMWNLASEGRWDLIVIA